MAHKQWSQSCCICSASTLKANETCWIRSASPLKANMWASFNKPRAGVAQNHGQNVVCTKIDAHTAQKR